jgi:hypothetical protein
MNAHSDITAAPPMVYAAIAAVTAAMSKDGIGKDRRNQQQGYNFRGIDEVYNALSPMLAAHKLCILPRMISREQTERQSAKGGALFYTTVEAEFDFVSAEDGSIHVVRTFGEAMDSADKSTNKAMSAAYKYAAMQTFCIPTEGDNDADATTHDVAPRQAQRQPAKQEAKPSPAPEVDQGARILAWVDKVKTKLTTFAIGQDDQLTAFLDSVKAKLDDLKQINPSLHAELDHAIGMARATTDDVPF